LIHIEAKCLQLIFADLDLVLYFVTRHCFQYFSILLSCKEKLLYIICCLIYFYFGTFCGQDLVTLLFLYQQL